MITLLTTAAEDSLNTVIAEKIKTISAMDGSEFLSFVIEELTGIGLRILAAIALYFVGAWLIRKTRKVLKKIFEKSHMDPSLSGFLISFVNITLTVIMLIIVVSILGVPTSTFTALVAAGGLAVGMALSGTLQNFAGGIMLLMFKPFKVGDLIDGGGYLGTVSVINITNTVLTTADNKCIVIPNGSLSNGNITNYSNNPFRRVDWTITISYGDDVSVAKAELLAIVNSDARVLQEPAAPFCALSELASSSINLVLRAWVKSEDYWSTYFDINERIYNELPQKGINFPFNQLDVFIKNK